MPYQSSDYQSPFLLSQKKKQAEQNQPTPADDATPQAELPTAEPAETAIAASLLNQEKTVIADAPAKKKAGRPKKNTEISEVPAVPAKKSAKDPEVIVSVQLKFTENTHWDFKGRNRQINGSKHPLYRYLQDLILDGHLASYICLECNRHFVTMVDEEGVVVKANGCPYCLQTKVKKW